MAIVELSVVVAVVPEDVVVSAAVPLVPAAVPELVVSVAVPLVPAVPDVVVSVAVPVVPEVVPDDDVVSVAVPLVPLDIVPDELVESAGVPVAPGCVGWAPVVVVLRFAPGAVPCVPADVLEPLVCAKAMPIAAANAVAVKVLDSLLMWISCCRVKLMVSGLLLRTRRKSRDPRLAQSFGNGDWASDVP